MNAVLHDLQRITTVRANVRTQGYLPHGSSTSANCSCWKSQEALPHVADYPQSRYPQITWTRRSADLDNHYTPTAVAKSLVAAVHDIRPHLVADLAAGRGDLLLEAERKWPTSTFAAADIDRCSIRYLARQRPLWMVGRCDLRNERSRSSSPILRELYGSVSLILLNPPFSCRGGTKHAVKMGDRLILASTAMSFLLTATTYVSKSGYIASIMPLGCLSSTRDRKAWDYLQRKFNVDLVETYPKGTFPNSAAATAIVRLSPYTGTRHAISFFRDIQPSAPILRIQVIRGGCQIHRANQNSSHPRLIHYTDIRNGSVEINCRRGSGRHPCVTGSLVLIPRVGRITPGKIVVYKAIERVMLSDCVIALKTKTMNQAIFLQNLLVDNFSRVRQCYVGTGAPFITIDRLRIILGSFGVYIE